MKKIKNMVKIVIIILLLLLISGVVVTMVKRFSTDEPSGNIVDNTVYVESIELDTYNIVF